MREDNTRIISGPVIRAPTGSALGPADAEQTLQQLQQEQMADIQLLQQRSAAARGSEAGLAVAALAAATTLAAMTL